MVMAKEVIPFPHEKTPREPDPIVARRSHTIVSVGNSRYAIDVTVSARPLPSKPAPVKVLWRKSADRIKRPNRAGRI